MYNATPVTAEQCRLKNKYEIVEPPPLSSSRVQGSEDQQKQKQHKDRLAGILGTYHNHLEERKQQHLGYPYNLDFDFDALQDLQKFSINNLGDPWVESNYGVHSRDFEVSVLNWFAQLWEIDVEEMWGYVTNCGTEGNLHGILVGREALPEGVLYCSKESHYSVMKAARMYRMPAQEVDTTVEGDIDLLHLEQCLRKGKQEGKGAIINVNCGTTVKGAVDDLDGILAVLAAVGYSEEEFYIHVDGALFGMMIPFVRNGSNGSLPGTPAPDADEAAADGGAGAAACGARMLSFRKPIGSVSVSGHKFIGAPVPCGVVMTRKRYIYSLSSDVEYLNSKDATIMGSRNGHAALYIWLALSQKGMQGLQRDVEQCMHNALLLKRHLEAAGVRCLLNPLSSTVVFDRPLSAEFIQRWQLACQGEVAHVVVMPSVSTQKLEKFVQELLVSNAAARDGAVGGVEGGELRGAEGAVAVK